MKIVRSNLRQTIDCVTDCNSSFRSEICVYLDQCYVPQSYIWGFKCMIVLHSGGFKSVLVLGMLILHKWHEHKVHILDKSHGKALANMVACVQFR